METFILDDYDWTDILAEQYVYEEECIRQEKLAQEGRREKRSLQGGRERPLRKGKWWQRCHR